MDLPYTNMVHCYRFLKGNTGPHGGSVHPHVHTHPKHLGVNRYPGVPHSHHSRYLLDRTLVPFPHVLCEGS